MELVINNTPPPGLFLSKYISWRMFQNLNEIFKTRFRKIASLNMEGANLHSLISAWVLHIYKQTSPAETQGALIRYFWTHTHTYGFTVPLFTSLSPMCVIQIAVNCGFGNQCRDRIFAVITAWSFGLHFWSLWPSGPPFWWSSKYLFLNSAVVIFLINSFHVKGTQFVTDKLRYFKLTWKELNTEFRLPRT